MFKIFIQNVKLFCFILSFYYFFLNFVNYWLILVPTGSVYLQHFELFRNRQSIYLQKSGHMIPKTPILFISKYLLFTLTTCVSTMFFSWRPLNNSLYPYFISSTPSIGSTLAEQLFSLQWIVKSIKWWRKLFYPVW